MISRNTSCQGSRLYWPSPFLLRNLFSLDDTGWSLRATILGLLISDKAA